MTRTSDPAGNLTTPPRSGTTTGDDAMNDNTINATAAYDMEVLGRATVDGRSWVIYSDGQYRHVVSADHYADSGCESRIDDDESRCDAYTAWCRRCRDAWADNATAVRVARECGCEFVHSAVNGCCSRLDVELEDRTYLLAYVREDGSWEIAQEFCAANDAAANAWAEANCDNDNWYVLDANRRNINAGADR